MAVDIDYCKRVRHLLIGADIHGISFRDLNARARTPRHPSADMREVLNAWKQRRWVDQFEVPMASGQASQRWRATQRLLEEWPLVAGAVSALLLAQDLPLAAGDAQTKSDHLDPSDPAVAVEV